MSFSFGSCYKGSEQIKGTHPYVVGKKLVRQKTLNFKACLLTKYRGNSRFKMIFCIAWKIITFPSRKCFSSGNMFICVFFAVLGRQRLFES